MQIILQHIKLKSYCFGSSSHIPSFQYLYVTSGYFSLFKSL